MNSPVEENYLKALFNLSQENGEVNVMDLSKQLEIKMPTVTSMMKKLLDKKLVHYESYKPIRLTDQGKKEAGLVIRKHRLTEMFLVNQMGFSWENVHEIAEQIEHINSPDLFSRMDEILGFPKTDPHGSPIPDSNGKIQWINLDKLCDAQVGEIFSLEAVMHSSDEFLKFLNSRNLHLGVIITVLFVEAFDGSMKISYADRINETLSKTASERLLVQKQKIKK